MFLRTAADLIRREKAALAAKCLRYEATGEHHPLTVFTDERRERAPDLTMPATKHVHDHVAADSKGELALARRLEADDEVVVYAKLPRGFSIPVPDDASYTRDWAVVFQIKDKRTLCFVIETKGDAAGEALRRDEERRVKRAKTYFRGCGRACRVLNRRR